MNSAPPLGPTPPSSRLVSTPARGRSFHHLLQARSFSPLRPVLKLACVHWSTRYLLRPAPAVNHSAHAPFTLLSASDGLARIDLVARPSASLLDRLRRFTSSARFVACAKLPAAAQVHLQFEPESRTRSGNGDGRRGRGRELDRARPSTPTEAHAACALGRAEHQRPQAARGSAGRG